MGKDLINGGDGGGELVETGSFRVDAGRMMEVLAKYQLRRPEEFLHALTRAAVAAGAARAGIRSDAAPKGTGIVFSFDACPYPAGGPVDLFAPLLEGARSPGRYFAAGLLALARTAPMLLEVCTAGARYELDGPQARRVGAAPEGLTEVRCLWSRANGPAGYSRTYLMSKCLNFPSSGALDCCPIPVQGPRAVNPALSGRRAEEGSYAFEKDGRYGFLKPLLGDEAVRSEGKSVIAVSVHGVLAERYEEMLPIPVSAEINDDSLSFDVSFSSCLQDERYAALEKYLAARSEAVALEEARRQQEEMPAVGRLLQQRPYRELWRARMGLDADWAVVKMRRGALRAFLGGWRWLVTGGKAAPWALPGEKQIRESRFAEIGSRTAWLRDLRGEYSRQGGRLFRALDAAPLLFSTSGKPLSVNDVRARAASGTLKVSEGFIGELLAGEDGVWLASYQDEFFLRSLVPYERWSGVYRR